jgi:hypothetical protein
VLVEQRDRHAVDLELGDEAELGVRLEAPQPRDPRLHFGQRVGVVERLHRGLVAHLEKAGDRLAADALRRTVGGDQLGMGAASSATRSAIRASNSRSGISGRPER